MKKNWDTVQGVVVRGYQVASGQASDSEYFPDGTIELQMPVFRRLGLDLSTYFPATLNISIAPCTFKMLHPRYTFLNVEWTDRHPPEHFSFSECRVIYQTRVFAGWVYYPHPETKKRHFQSPDLLEVIAREIPGIGYGGEVRLQVHPDQILLVRPDPIPGDRGKP